MNQFPLYSNDNNNGLKLNNTPHPSATIKEGMSPQEIANVISDKLITYVDKAFESVKQNASKQTDRP